MSADGSSGILTTWDAIIFVKNESRSYRLVRTFMYDKRCFRSKRLLRRLHIKGQHEATAKQAITKIVAHLETSNTRNPQDDFTHPSDDDLQ